MFYRMLGWAVWNGGKVFLRQKYGRAHVPKPVLAGAVLAAAGGVALLVTRHGADD